METITTQSKYEEEKHRFFRNEGTDTTPGKDTGLFEVLAECGRNTELLVKESSYKHQIGPHVLVQKQELRVIIHMSVSDIFL